MDEKGFAMGVIKSRPVVINVKNKRRFRMEPGNRDWVTVIECISPSGVSLAPFVVFRGAAHMDTWYQAGVPIGWRFSVSDKGWTDNDLGYRWLIQHFDPLTRPTISPNEWRSIMVDGHNSHITLEFQQFCFANRILIIQLPEHTTHWTQPLDVGVFGPLGHYYSEEVTEACDTTLGLPINKRQFIQLYNDARVFGFSEDNVRNAWAGAGMWPMDAEKVLSKLPPESPEPEMPTTPERPPKQPYDKTPTTRSQLHENMDIVLNRQLEWTPTTRMRLEKSAKATEKAMTTIELLNRRNEALEEALKEKKSRRQRGHRIMGVGRVITSELAMRAGARAAAREAATTALTAENAEKAVTKRPRGTRATNGAIEQALQPYCSVFQL